VKILTAVFALMLANVAMAQNKPVEKLIQYVDPLVGTANSTTASALKHAEGVDQFANTIPAVGVPFGMTQLTPQTNTGENKCVPPYLYTDKNISGFRATHWISGSCTQDYGSVTLMPVSGKLKTMVQQYAAPFSHQDETSTPDYYRLGLPQSHLIAELTSTARCGIMQFTSTQADSLYLLVIPNSDRGKASVQIDTQSDEVTGYNPAYRLYQGAGKPAGFSGYFVIKVQKVFNNSGTFSEGNVSTANSISNQKDIGAFLGFKLNKGEKLIVKIGTSFTSIDEARKNLQAEIPGWDFNAVRSLCTTQWENALRRIKAEGTKESKQTFYTAMYHTMQLPRLYNDVDGSYPMFSHQYKTTKLLKGNYYDDFSMWDIYRAELPLYEIIDPALISSLVNSVIQKGKQGGWMPIFPCWNSYTNEMIGDHTTAFIASAYLKGIKGYDMNEAYRLMRQNAFDTPPDADYRDGKGRRVLNDYLKYGYVPLENPVKYAFHKDEQVSRTMEYAYDDYALAMVAKTLHKSADYSKLIKRAANYKNVFDTQTGFVRGKYADGTWFKPFNPDSKASFITEGTARQYTFYAPQDIPGLTKLMGGKAKLEQALDSLFIKGEYWHGNEPGQQIPFMYNYTNAPWKTQRAVDKILREEYSNGPGGLSGQDDAGQVSAWCVFGMLGMYPVDPVSGEYMLTSPALSHAVISLPGKRRLEIIAYKKSPNDIYISSVKLNGKPYTKNYITQQALAKGGKLEFWLQATPNKSWGVKLADQPGSNLK
jgi:predicted alpha-1,2-mannosidase